MSAISLPLRLQQTSSSFSLCLRYFLERIWRGRRENCTVGSKKKKRETFPSTPVGTGKNGSCKEGRGTMKSVLWGTREKKNEFLQKKTLIQQQTRKKCSKNLFPSRISFFPICLFSSLLFSFPKKTKILFLLFKFPLR